MSTQIIEHFPTAFDAVIYLMQQDYQLIANDNSIRQVYRNPQGDKAIFKPSDATLEIFLHAARKHNA